MSEYGVLSLLPPLVAIVLAIRTKMVYLALTLGIWLGWLVISGFNPISGTVATINAFVDVFLDAGNTKTLMFCTLVGALLVFIQRSGGVEGFLQKINRLTSYFESKKNINNKIIIQLLAALTGVLLFIETSISALTVGSIFRPLFDKNKISREKLAYIADSTAAPSSILIPLNAWGAFIMGLLITQGFENPFKLLYSAFPFNFYPMITILLVFLVIILGKDFKIMRLAEKRVQETGRLLNEGSKPMVSNEITSIEKVENVKARARNMIIPMAVMVLSMPFYLILTGWDATSTESQIFSRIFAAIGNGSGSTAVLYAVLSAIFVAMIIYRLQKIMRTKEMIDLTLDGISGILPLALLMMMAFAISNVCKELGTGVYVAEVSKNWLTPSLVPAIIFAITSFVAFSTGTSWGTFAIMMSISVPLAQSLSADLSMAIAATLGGGVFGDHCSPISDTTIIASMASASDHIDHVKTQLPYALICGGITFLLYLILGFL
jgi:tetracycline resistance efflux pump